MDVTKICQLKDAPVSDKPELYKQIIKDVAEICKKNESNISEKDLEVLCQEILHDLTQHSLSNVVLEQLEFLLNVNRAIKQILTGAQQKALINGIINVIKNCQGDDCLILCFSCLNEIVIDIKLENDMLEDLLPKAAEIISKKTVPEPLYITVCNYIQKFFKEYEDNISSFMHIAPKLIYPPLSHSCCKVREIAEKTLDNFPKLVLFAENEVAANVVLKLLKEPYCKELLFLFKEKQELFVLKVWKHVINSMGKTLHYNLPALTNFFQVIEKGFKSMDDDVCKSSFLTWKHLISNLALDAAILNDSKKLRFVLKPFKNLSKFNECVSFAVCDTWWHLAWSLSNNLSSRFTEVLIPLLEFTLGKSQGSHEKANPKGNQIFLVKRGCHFLLRLLEQCPNNSLSKISSPKKLPPLLYIALQVPIDIKVIVRHFKEIVPLIKVVIEVFGHTKDMASHIECLLKSVLFIISAVIEDKNKESIEAMIVLIGLIDDIIEAQICPPLICLKSVDSLSKLPRSLLVSHCFNNGPRKSQDILCIILLKLLVNPFLFSTEMPQKRFLMAYNRLIQAALGESLNPLLMAHKLINIVKHITSQNIDAEILFEIWSGIASPLLEAIEKTQEVNQGDRQEHDFSCLYDVLLCPFENIFPVSMNQLRNKPAFRLWTNLYKTFVRCASLVPTTLPNEACEHFCARLKPYFKDDLLKEPQYFEAVCSLLQNVLESIDFSSVGSSSTSGFGNGSLLMKKKKPLGNLTSFVDLLSFLLTCFYANYIEHEDDIYQSCTPKAQRKGHISKTAVPLDLLKTFFGNLKTGSVISSVLEELAVPLSKFFAITQKKANANIIGAKLEVLWNVVTSSIEIHYLGPYDTDFLTTMCPLLESSITHFRRHIKERSRRFWFATFAPVISSLTLPESFKNILKKSKLSLMPDENVSSLEDCMYNPASDSIEDEIVNFENVTSLKESSVKTSEVSKVNESKSTKEAESKVMKEKKLSINKNVDELSSSEFVKIDNPTYVSLTPRRRSFRNRKSFIPTMYNDLSQSQDTTLGGSSESFDTSSSCEIVEFKSLEECDKPLVASSKNGNFNEDAEKSVVSSKIIDLHDSTSSIEILTSMNGIVNSIEEALNLEEINAGKSEVVCENTFPLKTSSSLDTNKIDQNITNCAGSLDVIIVSSSDDISVQKIVIDSKSLNSDSINDVEKCNQDPISETDCKPNQTELKKKKRRLKRRNSNDDLKDSQEMAKMEESSLDNSAKKDSLISDYKFEKENGEPLLNPQGSQRTKKFKLHIESANKEQVLPKKNGKCKQSIITSHLKSISKTDDNKSHLESQNIKLSESLANESSSTNNNQSSISDIKKTCDEIVDLSDSEEIIPSSQSSVDSMSYVKFPALEKSPKRTLIFNNFDGEANLDLPSVKNNAEQKSDIQVEENSNECPETPIDLIETPCKGSISSEVFSQISSFSVAKTISSMPLKSSENLVNSNELLNKIDNNGIKTDLSSVILQKNEEKKDLKAENTPPLYTEAYNVQTSEPVLLQNAHTEEKIRSFAASKLLNVAVENDEDSPKTVRIKSLRSASKNTSRKSFSSAVKKTVKKPVKRKSMPNLNPLSKVEKLDTVEEGVTFEGLSKSDSLTLSNENVNQPETNSQFENKLQDKVSLISVSSSVTTDSEIEQNSILEDIADVISDIHEKLESYNDAYTCEFSLNMTAEVEQDSNKIGLTSCMDLATSEESLEKSNKEFREESIDASVIISGNNSNVNAVFENVVLKPVDENCINLSSAILKISENLEIEKSGSGLNYKENTEMSEEPSKDNCSLIHDMQKSETDIDDNCLKIVSLPVRSFEADEKDKLLIHVSEELNNIENKDSEMRSDIQSDQHFDKSFHECVLSIESKADEKEFNKTAVRKSIPSNNIESYEIVELSVQGEHDSIGNVFNAVSNIDQGSKALLSSYTQHNDIKNSSSGLLNGVVEETEQKIMNKEKFNYINSMEYSNQIDKDIGDSCCDEIKEIQETCEMDDNQNISANSRNLSLEGKRAPEISYPLSFLENDIVSTDVEIGKIDGNKEPFFSQAEDSKTGSICIENLVKKEREIKELDALESNSNVSVVHVDLKQSISIPTDDMHGAPVQCNVAACQEIAENENFANKAINVNCSSLPGTMVCTANSTSDFADKEIESSSRRRKAKCPVRSAFNFRHRSNVLVSMTKSFPKNNDQNTSKEVNDKNGKKTVHIIQKKLLENNNKKVKKFSDSKIHNDPSKVEDGDNLIQNSSNSSLDTVDVSKKPVTSTKRPKTILSYQEITDVNTRFNASMAPQTRRLKMLASSVHKSLPVQDDVYSLGENDITCMENENSISTSSSILKKRKASSDPGPSKHRKVTFADPLVEERLFRNDDNLSDRILKASILLNINDSEHDSSPQDIDKVTKVRDENTNVSVKPIPSTDDIPSSSEYQSSDENLTNYCNFPISPLLINCEESVCSILNELTTPTWAHGLVTLLFSKNIKTIGDLCKLNVHELRALPLKSPKVACLHNALITHLKRTQDATSEKLNSEDWCFGTDSTENKNSEIHTDVNWKGKTESEIFEGVAQELLCDDRIQKLSTETLIALSKKSFLEMTKRLEDV